MKLILWDWNGTLLNDAPVTVDIFNMVRVECGYEPVSLEQYRELYRHPIRTMYEEAGMDLSKHTFESLADRWNEIYSTYHAPPSLHDDAVSVLQAFQEKGHRQSILSALPHNILERSVRTLDVERFFETIHGALDTLGHGKVDMGKEVAQNLGVTGREIVIIGDSSHDAEVAQELGSHCFLVARGAESEARLTQTGFPVCATLLDVYIKIHGAPLIDG
jgi:phosphoglycolate phosphatase